jgi:hypothetical protein
MTLSRKEIEELHPKLDNQEQPIETPSAYAHRVRQVLPNFPEQVVTQWFFEHHQCIEEYVWLDYSNLRFVLTEIGPDVLGLRCLQQHETVVQYRDYFMRGTPSQRMNRLGEYISAHGTWPVPPLVFDNSDGVFAAPWGLRYSVPYDLLEGHHRMAVLYGLGRHSEGSHQVWMVQRSESASDFSRASTSPGNHP